MNLRAWVLLGSCLPWAAQAAAAGYVLRMPGKAPLAIAGLEDPEKGDQLPLKEALAYLGGQMNWRSDKMLAEMQGGTAKASMMLEENWICTETGRVRLSGSLHWKEGRLVLDKSSLEKVIETLGLGAGKVQISKATLKGPQPTATKPVDLAEATAPKEILSPLRPSHSGIRKLVIDAGHGGYDPGAHGPGGIKEKDACLDIALRLRSLVKKRMPGVEVILTRASDDFVSLRERTIKANKADADLFVSIHNNASPSRKSRGSQVFFYDSHASDKAAEDLARQENQDANYLEILMQDLGKTGPVRDESIALGQHVQDELRADLGIQSRRLSCAPFYVLARTKMPAILVEVAFITNPKEAALLRSSSFRENVAQGIFRGLTQYSPQTALR
ncbi:MAG: N-acetylmuramoyl-L-alanine amidase [candidate division FCPU426 bacterium]